MNSKLFTLTPLAVALVLAGCNSSSKSNDGKDELLQPAIESRVHAVIEVDGYQFRDANGNGKLEPYEDWRLSAEERSADLVKRMSLEEKTGMMMIDTLNADSYGKLPDAAKEYVNNEKMTRFIFRNPVMAEPDRDVVGGRSGAEITPEEAAIFMNSMQELAEKTPHGIPVLFKSNARNHIDPAARAGINVSSGAFSAWPKEAGLAATRDMDLIAEFSEVMNDEWSSIGLRSMYGYMMDLATEPRWYRVHETFTEDAELAADIMASLITGLQGKSLNEDSIALTIKHFPGGGPQEDGGDPHYDFGKNQNYEGDNFDYHLIPFIAAIDAGAASIMPYYGIPVDQDVKPNDVGMSFSKGIVTELLRKDLKFQGYVNTDTGIIGDRAWGLEDLTEQEQIAVAVEAGSDVLSGYHTNKTILDVLESDDLTEDRVDISVQRLLKEQFQLGLFENAYVDPQQATVTLGKKEYQDLAFEAQRKSVVLLDNKGVGVNKTLPLVSSPDDKVKVYTMGVDTTIAENAGFDVVSGDYEDREVRPEIPADTDYAMIRVFVTNDGSDPELIFGGANPDELSTLDFTGMEAATSWSISPSLNDIQSVMNEIGAEKTILAINFRQPFVLDEESGMKNAGATLATFGVSDAALMDVIAGEFNPQGKLPFALANNAGAIQRQFSDTPGYQEGDTLYPFGWGLSYGNTAQEDEQ
ncbi:glycoside hydrolase family 3 C-terminal domain-containing protein [Photobacterium sp. SDRW27]|uniref:glycoside hydrolase family 3 protein n=1 Tax=Photobacterium obscurum TaxID=2829490 RepID=UPI002243CB68|nr:glycoside hydrolase family 3 N-terminal domain-containing protein [Photobacterium obscurum]MCW8331003.1 glycoside hydrolase family 3 C-terminal domain-containing protein [Photobacterium obscurum]